MKPESKQQAQQRLEGYTEYLRQTIGLWKTPGMAVGIVMDGELIFAEGVGLRDVKNRLPVTPQTVFNIASATKAFTAVSVGIGVDEGKLEWDKPVRTWLPDFSLYDPIATQLVTLRDMLCHRTGVPGHILSFYGSGRTREEKIASLRYLEPSCGFREKHQYMNTMYQAAGYLAGKVHGLTWEELTQKRILDPLGMTSTHFSAVGSQENGEHSRPYHEIDGEVVELPYQNLADAGPEGGISSNVVDMAKWMAMHLSRGKAGDVQIISEASLAQCHEPIIRAGEMLSGVKFPECGKATYSMGWYHQRYRGEDWMQHSGGIDGFVSLVSLLPALGIGLVALSNCSSGIPVFPVTLEAFDRLLDYPKTDWSRRIQGVLSEEVEAEDAQREELDSALASGASPLHALSDYEGEYQKPGYPEFRVKAEGNGLTARFGARTLPLTHFQDDRFWFQILGLGPAIMVSFVADGDGRIEKLSMPIEPTVKDIVFSRRAASGAKG